MIINISLSIGDIETIAYLKKSARIEFEDASSLILFGYVTELNIFSLY